METIRLSPRLNAVLQFMPKSACLADIGSDHAHLPSRAVQDGRTKFAIAGEVRQGPYHQSLINIASLGLRDKIDVRMGDGLDVIREPHEADAVVIAGMGGELIADILERGKEKLRHDTVLILQPNSREARVRKWLDKNGWMITNEAIIEETPHFYEVMQAKKAKHKKMSELELQMGPFLSVTKESAFLKKWRRRERRLVAILQELRQAEHTQNVRRKEEESEHELKLIRSCLDHE